MDFLRRLFPHDTSGSDLESVTFVPYSQIERGVGFRGDPGRKEFVYPPLLDTMPHVIIQMTREQLDSVTSTSGYGLAAWLRDAAIPAYLRESHKVEIAYLKKPPHFEITLPHFILLCDRLMSRYPDDLPD